MTTSAQYCGSCGAALRVDSRFCEACGQPVGAEGGTATLRGATASTTTPSCPSCQLSDQVVTAAAYDPGTDSEVKGNDERVSPDTVALFLEKPERPEPKSVLLWGLSVFIPTLVFFIYFFAPIHRGFKFFLFGLTIAFGVSVFVPELYKTGLYPIIGLFLILFYWGALFIGRDAHNVELVTRRLPEYSKAIARWEHLRYCKRCQRAWLDNVIGAVPVEVTDVEAIITP